MERERKKQCVVERILNVEVLEGDYVTYQVKWGGDLGYDQATWESAADLPPNTRVDEFNAFRARSPDQYSLKPFYYRPPKSKKFEKYVVFERDRIYYHSFVSLLTNIVECYKILTSNTTLEHRYTDTTLPGCSEDGMRLRDYQVGGVNWLIKQWYGGT